MGGSISPVGDGDEDCSSAEQGGPRQLTSAPSRASGGCRHSESGMAMTDESQGLVSSSLGATLEQANPAPVELEDPGLVLGGRVELRSYVGDAESVSWVEYQACPAGSCDWQVLARSQAAPFAALVETAALPDGDYDMRLLVGRRDGLIEASRPLRRRLLANKPTVSLRQPQPGAWVGGAVALVARRSAAAAELPLRFQFSSDHTS